MAKTAVIILGMHRSGTSCLTGSLERAGLYLGTVNREAPHNAKGNRENQCVVEINDAVLSNNGAAWDNPPTGVVQWSSALKDRRDLCLSKYPDEKIIGFKDPRTLFTLEGWLEAIPDAALVGTFRHPQAVACSLNRRKRMLPAISPLDLWKKYNLRLLNYLAEFQFPLICFDRPAEQYLRELEQVVDRLGLPWPRDPGFHFFDEGLRRSQLSYGEAGFEDDESRIIYEQLLHLAVSG